MLIDIGTEQPTYNRYIANNRCAILGLLDILTHQAAKNHCRSIVNADTGRDFAGTKDRLIDHVRSEKNTGGTQQRCYSSQWVHTSRRSNCSKNRTAIVNEAFKFHNLRDKVEINSNSVRSYDGFNFQGD